MPFTLPDAQVVRGQLLEHQGAAGPSPPNTHAPCDPACTSAAPAGASCTGLGCQLCLLGPFRARRCMFADLASMGAAQMSLAGNSSEDLARTKTEYESFLGDPKQLAAVREMMQQPDLSDDQVKTLKIFERTFQCYIIEDAAAVVGSCTKGWGGMGRRGRNSGTFACAYLAEDAMPQIIEHGQRRQRCQHCFCGKASEA
eukprot:363193-Chlamydomonas_euryale.AAC.5